MSQTSVPTRSMDEGKPGLIAEPFQPKGVETLYNTSANLFMGRAIVPDGEGKCKHPTLSTHTISGVVACTHAIESEDDSEEPHYEPKDDANFLYKGKIWAVVDRNVAVGDAVYYRYSGKKQVQTIVLSADLITGNTLAGTLGGEAISVPFNTDHDTTMADLETAVEAVDGIASATVGGTGNRTLTIVTTQDNDDVDLGGDWEVTGGASQATVTEAETEMSAKTTDVGKFGPGADADETATATCKQLTNARWVRGGSAGGVALLELNVL